MSYTPPSGSAVNFSFALPLNALVVNFTATSYSPPPGDFIHFNFLVSLLSLNFEFAPEVPEPISKEMLLSLGVRLHGQVYKYWICYVIGGKQYIRRYGKEGLKDPWWTSTWQVKFAAGVKAWKNLSDSDKLYWRHVGSRKKEPITSINAFLSAWMKDKI